MRIEVVGTQSPESAELFQRCQVAIESCGIHAEIRRVEDLPSIIACGTTRIPALVIDGRVVFGGRPPSVEEIRAFLDR